MRDCSTKMMIKKASDKPVSNVRGMKRKSSEEVTTSSKKQIKKEVKRAVMQTAPKKEPRHLLQKNKVKKTKKSVEKKQKQPKTILYEGVKSCDIVSRRGAANNNNEGRFPSSSHFYDNPRDILFLLKKDLFVNITGNIRFRKLVRAFKPDYERNDNKEYRRGLAETIVNRLKPGRFIKYEDGSDEPIILDHTLSVRKVS